MRFLVEVGICYGGTENDM